MIDPYIDNVEKLQKQFEKSKNQLKVIEDEIRFIKKDLEISRARFAENKKKKDDTIPRLSEKKVKLERAISLSEETEELKEKLSLLKNKVDKLEAQKKRAYKKYRGYKGSTDSLRW